MDESRMFDPTKFDPMIVHTPWGTTTDSFRTADGAVVKRHYTADGMVSMTLDEPSIWSSVLSNSDWQASIRENLKKIEEETPQMKTYTEDLPKEQRSTIRSSL